ncbi:MAG: 8-amino-7-oxononanoate synthase [Candidatus Desulfatibia sp.]|uniref:8-amino-7-oxononanoate synthase n=1 Tax=Candidatus Desulfatibia sp. TaxID=3101189 RepID=UPI002F2DFB91
MNNNRQLDTYFGRELASLRERGLFRELRVLPETGGKLSIEGRKVLNFSSNDYLNLANHHQVKVAAIGATERWGCGATASRLMSGHLELHAALETDLARMVAAEAALVFGSGFLVNIGVLTAIAGREDEIFADRLNHASLIDGMLLSGAKWHRYRHKDIDHLERLLKKSKTGGRRIIVTDSIFSMDGDIAPLKCLAELAERYKAIMVVDEAHAIGVMGARGGGVCRIKGQEIKPEIVIGTLSKALGGYGGFVACSDTMRSFLINRARSFIYSTGLPPACLGGSHMAVALVESMPQMGQELLARVQRFREFLVEEGFSLPEIESQILPIHIGDNQQAMNLAGSLWEKGIMVSAIRPPTVPAGTARLRMSVTLAHSIDDLQFAAKELAQSARQWGVL